MVSVRTKQDLANCPPYTPTLAMIRNLRQARVRFRFDTLLGLVDVRDVVAAHLRILTHGRPREKYLFCAGNLSMDDLISFLPARHGGSLTVPMPYPLAFTIAWASGALSRVSGRDPVVLPQSLALARLRPGFDGSKAGRELELTYRPLEERLRDSLAVMD